MRNCSRCQVLLALFVTTLLSISGSAFADEDPRIARAQVFFAEGLRAAGDHRDADALRKFEEAYAVYPSANILAAIGREKQVLGRELEGLADLKRAARDRLLHPDNVSKVNAQIAEIQGKFGRLQFVGPSSTRVRVHGIDQTLPLDEPLDVPPGSYVAKVTYSGKTKTVTGEAKPGAITTVNVAMEERSADPPPAGVGTERHGTVWMPLTLVFGGAALATAGLALYFNGKSRAVDDRATALRNEHAGANCSVPSQSFCGEVERLAGEQARAADTAQYLWIGTGVLTAGAIASGVLWWKNTSPRRMSGTLVPIASPSTAGAMLRLSF